VNIGLCVSNSRAHRVSNNPRRIQTLTGYEEVGAELLRHVETLL
jgi:hypothetical protein